MNTIVDKNKMMDVGGRFLSQSLFLEVNYTPNATYTLKDKDHEWEGHIYPSLKRLYLELEDPTEYEFANTYLLGWRHWQKILGNKLLIKHVEEWREELEFKLRAKGVKTMMLSAASGNYQASKWLVDRGWDVRGAGRPSKRETEGQKALVARVGEEYGADVIRMFQGQG
jgi:hypothetical protein